MSKPLLITAAGAIIAVIAIALNVFNQAPESPAQPNQKPAVSKPADSTQKTVTITPPSFDVVRVNPRGDTIIAGRGMPKHIIIIKDGDVEIGRIPADSRGEWVFVPGTPLKPGSHQLSLEMLTKDGIVRSDDVVVLVVPQPGMDIAGRKADTGQQVLAVRVPRRGDGPTKVLQRPSGDLAKLALSVDAIDYTEGGRLRISGHAQPDAAIHLYLDNAFIGRTTTNADAVWSMVPNTPVAKGDYTLRADQVDKQGKVIARVTLPFTRASPTITLEPGTFFVVQPGNSLWRIARRAYGTGMRFTVIYNANRNLIKNPDMIFPGQVFTLPEKK